MEERKEARAINTTQYLSFAMSSFLVTLCPEGHAKSSRSPAPLLSYNTNASEKWKHGSKEGRKEGRKKERKKERNVVLE
jgi:hypothetical protein